MRLNPAFAALQPKRRWGRGGGKDATSIDFRHGAVIPA
jgi:hypothetical protein